MSSGALIRFQGNCPGAVNRDAKYGIRRGSGELPFVVAAEYRTADGERWYASTEAHPELVAMVNAVKLAVNGAPCGPFYINEYRQVLVPAGDPVTYYLAGRYANPLVFDFEGVLLSGLPNALDGRPLKSGEAWEGVHPGIPYKLKAGARDISYEAVVRPNVTREVLLSAHVGAGAAQQMAARLRDIMGFEGGRFYVNEFRCLFTGQPYRYLGRLEQNDPWFPEPHAAG